MRKVKTEYHPPRESSRLKRPPTHLRGLGSWLISAPLVLGVLLCISQLAILRGVHVDLVDTRSNLQADYGPWTFLVLHRVRNEIIREVIRDQERDPLTSGSPVDPRVLAGEFWLPTQPLATGEVQSIEENPPQSATAPVHVATATPSNFTETATTAPSPTPILTSTAIPTVPTPTWTPTIPPTTTTGPPAVDWWDCNWTSRLKLTFDNSARSESLKGFPVLVVLGGTRIDYGQTQNNGQDIRFLDADGSTVLAHEIERWDERGQSYIWVRVPQIDASSASDSIWLYYNNPTAADGQNATGVWDSNYVGVWHLREDPSGPAPSMKDSTSHANHGSTKGGMTGSDQVPGRIDGSLDLDGDDDTVEVGADPSLDFTGGPLTIEVWAYPRGGWVEQGSRLVRRGTWGRDFEQYRLSIDLKGVYRFAQFVYGDQSLTTPYGLIALDQWQYLVARYDGSALKIFLDGQLKASLSATVAGSSTSYNLYLGSEINEYNSLYGQIDEVRISSRARSEAWIAAQYQSMIDAFVAYGAAQTSGCGP